MDKVIHTIPFLRITFALVAGIALGPLLHISIVWLFPGLLLCVAVLLLINSRYRFSLSACFGVGVHLFFIGTGIFLWMSYNRQPEYADGDLYKAVVLESPVEKSNTYQSVLQIEGIIKKDSLVNTREKLMVWFEKNDSAWSLEPGQTILFRQTPRLITNHNNPFEFNYEKYLADKRIYRQVYLSSNAWWVYDKHPVFSLQVMAERVRGTLLAIYAQQGWEEYQYDIISALTLGYKRELDPEIKNTFKASGTMHVLAVSGLHTGIVFFMLGIFLGFVKSYRYGRMLFVVLVVGTLWAFAFLTGLSPSVKRAVTMFTFVVIGQNLGRQVNIYNTLFASAFFLLIANPNLLFDVGFQLSYAAVFGIVFLQPRLAKLINSRQRVIRYGWTLLTVSVAAQIATFPITSYYFHQFPVYFWLSNMLVIPVVTLLIPMAFLLLALHWVPLVAPILAYFIKTVSELQVQFLEFIEMLPVATVPVHLSSAEFLLVITTVVFLFFLIGTGKPTYLKYMLGSLVLYLVTLISWNTYLLFQKEIIVYNFNEQHVVHFISGKRNYIVSEEEVERTPAITSLINNVVVGLRLRDPVLLTMNQNYTDSVLCLRNGLAYFEGEVVAFHAPPDAAVFPVNPDILVYDHKVFTQTDKKVQADTACIEKQLTHRQLPHLYNLREKGAYIKKW